MVADVKKGSAFARRLAWVSVGSTTAIAGVYILVLAACQGKVDPTSYGNPNTLDRKAIPGEGGTEIIACTDAGGKFDGGCPSFATDIFPYVRGDGGWRCADKACHGGTQTPLIADDSPAACLESLKKATVGGKPYVATAGGDGGNESTFACNLQGTCGSKMPDPPGQDPKSDEICMVQAWIQCGAPP